MSYTTGYVKGKQRAKARRRASVKSAVALKKNLIGSFFNWVANQIGNRDGRISKEEYAEAIEYRDTLMAELEAGGNYLRVLLTQWEDLATRLGAVHGDLENTIDAYFDLKTIAPNVWAEFREPLEDVWLQDMESPLQNLNMNLYQTELDRVAQAIEDVANSFIDQIDYVYEEFASQGIKSLYHPFAQKRLQLEDLIRDARALRATA